MNYIAILVSAIITMVIGSFWYSPVMFAKPWMKAMGFDKKMMDANRKKGTNVKYTALLVGALLQAFILAWFINMLGIHTALGGFQTGFFAWLGFTATTYLATWMFSSKPKELYIINVTYSLVVLCINGALLAVWR